MLKGLDVNDSGLILGHCTELRQQGFQFVGRYLPDGIKRDPLTRAEAAHAKANGVGIWSIYEHGNPTSIAYFTDEQGDADGARMLTAGESVGQPEGTYSTFTIDYDASEADYDRIAAYFTAIRSVVKGRFLLAVYGGGYVIGRLKSDGLVHKTVLAGSMGFLGSREYTDWAIRQLDEEATFAGFQIDTDEAIDGSLFW